MSTSVLLVWDPGLVAYDFGPSHPLAPVRVDLTMRLARELGVFDPAHVTPRPGPAGRRAGPRPRPRRRLPRGRPARRARTRGPPTCSAASARATTPPSPACTRSPRWSPARPWRPPRRSGRGRAEHAVNIAGGLHHAMPGAASGFCVFNDVALAIARLLELGAPAGGVRRRRRPPRRRRPGDLLRRPAGADDLAARDRHDAVPRHGLPRRDRRPGRRGHLRERRPAARDVRREPGCGPSTGSSRPCCARSPPTSW